MSEILIIIALIIFNGLLSMSEIALISARQSSLARDEKQGDRAARAALKLTKNPDRFLSTVQIGITVVGILTGLYSGDVIADDFSDVLVGWGVSSAYAHGAAQTTIVIIVTYLTLIIGELIPKKIGMTVAEKTAKVVARPMMLLSSLAMPLVWILSKSTSAVYKMLGIRPSREKVTEEEIRSMIEEGTRDGEVQEVEQDIVERVFMVGDLKVASLMTHRTEVVCIDISMKSDEVRALIKRGIFEMYPAIDGSVEKLRGMVYLKDLVIALDDPDFSIENIMRPAVYFHQTMSVYKALQKMKEQRVSQTVVCDEFGSLQGVITLKDILEALVGSVAEEHEEPEIIARKDGGWLVDGQCSFFDFLSYFEREDLHAANHDINTLGGLLIELLEHIPLSGEVVSWSGFNFEIVDMDGARIDKVLVTKI